MKLNGSVVLYVTGRPVLWNWIQRFSVVYKEFVKCWGERNEL